MRRLTTLLILVAAALAFGCTNSHGLTFFVPTEGMMPTINPGDSVAADVLYYKHSPVQRGDIVVVKDPDGKMTADGKREDMYVKRIIGIGGDKIQILAGSVYVNDRLLNGFEGKYARDFPVEDFGPVNVPAGKYFLVGDNLPDSIDSRQWKRSTVNIDDIYGKVTAIQQAKTKEIRYL